MAERLRRLEQIFKRSPIYFVTACIANRRWWLGYGFGPASAAGVPSPYWQKGFFDHVLRSGESYEAKWHYVRDNPVRAGLASSWEEWPFLGEVCRLEFRRDRF